MNMRKLKKNVMAVSPVIATLMLVLVSVGAAGALYMWQAGWQETVEDEAGNPTAKTMIRIGGSSTVYEFSTIAKELFELQNSDFRVDLQKGGSTSGVQGAGWGLVDIGASSSDPTEKFDTYNLPDFDQDGNRDIGLPDMQTHLVAYDGVSMIVSATEGPASNLIGVNRSTVEGMYNGSINDWANVPTFPGSNDTCTTTSTPITTYDRADHSGTEECFCKKLMNKQIDGGAKQMDGIADVSEYSNQNLINGVAGDGTAIGFMAVGMIDSSVNEVEFYLDQVRADATDGDNDGLADDDEIKSGVWPGSRPLVLITVGDPSGSAKRFIDFCLTTDINQEIAESAGYVSIYG